MEPSGDKLHLRKSAILILGYLAQYAMLPMRTVSASIAAVPRSLEEAAWLSGAGWLATLRHIVAPLAGRGLLAAWLISYVFCVRDVAISIVVYPPGYDTLPVRNPHAHGQWRAESHFGALYHSHRDHDSAARCGRPMGQVRREPPVSKIDFRSVTKLYRDRRVVDALSLVIEVGGACRVVRAFRLWQIDDAAPCRRMVAPDSGEIRIDGKVVSSARKILVRRSPAASGWCFKTSRFGRI